MEDLLTIPEAAREARIGKSTLYLAAQQGQIPVVRLGRSVRIRRETLRRWILDHEGIETNISDDGKRKVWH